MPPHGSFGLADLGAPGFLQGLVLKGSNKAIRVAMRVPLRVYYNGLQGFAVWAFVQHVWFEKELGLG